MVCYNRARPERATGGNGSRSPDSGDFHNEVTKMSVPSANRAPAMPDVSGWSLEDIAAFQKALSSVKAEKKAEVRNEPRQKALWDIAGACDRIIHKVIPKDSTDSQDSALRIALQEVRASLSALAEERGFALPDPHETRGRKPKGLQTAETAE